MKFVLQTVSRFGCRVDSVNAFMRRAITLGAFAALPFLPIWAIFDAIFSLLRVLCSSVALW